MLSLGTFIFVLFYITTYSNGAQGLKNVKLHLDPSIVQKGESSTIECAYDLEGAQLYTVKWYRGHHEFYRYTPSEHPSTKIFPYTGLHVNLELSNEHQVVLRKVGFNLSGNFSCEVTTEAPFSTAVVSENMLVVVLPSIHSVPTLNADKTYYIIGDTLRANCTSPPSRPAATLTFYMNNQVVCEKCQTRKRAIDELFVSDLSLELPLFPSHFAAGQLILRCVAQIGDLYNQNSETRLDNTKDPVPERVTSPNHATTLSTITIENVLIRLFLYFILIFR